MVNKGAYFYGFARTVPVRFTAKGKGSTEEWAVFSAPFRCKVRKCVVVFDDAVTGNATNNFGMRFKNKGSDGSGTDVIATKTFSSGVNASQFDEIDLGEISNNTLNENDTVTVEKFENGAGLAGKAGVAILEITRA